MKDKNTFTIRESFRLFIITIPHEVIYLSLLSARIIACCAPTLCQLTYKNSDGGGGGGHRFARIVFYFFNCNINMLKSAL